MTEGATCRIETHATHCGPSPLLSRRRTLLIASMLIHSAVLVLLSSAAQSVTFNRPIAIEIVSQGDGLTDLVATTAATAPLPEPSVEDPQAVEPVDTPTPVKTPIAEITQPPPKEPALPTELTKKKRPHKVARRTRPKDVTSRGNDIETTEARRAGSPMAQPGDTGAARVSYGALISAELNRHKFYPASARQRGNHGSVAATFTVGNSGRIVSHAITHSSGSAELDAVVHEMMAAAQCVPPPGGSFRGAIVVSFSLR
jgi:protein TonB